MHIAVEGRSVVVPGFAPAIYGVFSSVLVSESIIDMVDEIKAPLSHQLESGSVSVRDVVVTGTSTQKNIYLGICDRCLGAECRLR